MIMAHHAIALAIVLINIELSLIIEAYEKPHGKDVDLICENRTRENRTHVNHWKKYTIEFEDIPIFPRSLTCRSVNPKYSVCAQLDDLVLSCVHRKYSHLILRTEEYTHAFSCNTSNQHLKYCGLHIQFQMVKWINASTYAIPDPRTSIVITITFTFGPSGVFRYTRKNAEINDVQDFPRSSIFLIVSSVALVIIWVVVLAIIVKMKKRRQRTETGLINLTQTPDSMRQSPLIVRYRAVPNQYTDIEGITRQQTSRDNTTTRNNENISDFQVTTYTDN